MSRPYSATLPKSVQLNSRQEVTNSEDGQHVNDLAHLARAGRAHQQPRLHISQQISTSPVCKDLSVGRRSYNAHNGHVFQLQPPHFGNVRIICSTHLQ
eukprot:6398450-Amphidinium_carterae.1